MGQGGSGVAEGQCPNCGGDVDPYDDQCPHCEYRLPSSGQKWVWLLIAAVLLGFVVWLVLAAPG